MVTITHERTWARDEFRGLQNVTDMEIARIDGTVYLYTIDAADGTIASFDISSGDTALVNARIVDDEIAGTADTIRIMENGGECVIVTAGATAGEMRAYGIGASDGAVGGRTGELDALDGVGSVSAMGVYMRKGIEYLAAATQDGLGGFDRTGGAFSETSTVSGPGAHIGDVTDVQFVRGPFGHYVFASSGTEGGVSLMRAGGPGRLNEYDTLGAEDGLWVSGVSDLATVDTLGRDFLLVADQAGGSVSSVRIDADGTMTVVDQVFDDRDTRFDDVSVMEAFSMKHRDFVALGGSDGGVTVMEVLYNGTLREAATLGGDGMLDWGSVSDIAVKGGRGEATLFVSTGDGGFSQFELDFGRMGTHRAAPEDGGRVGGSRGSDLVSGSDMDDRLYGGKGDDVIYDGDGFDYMAGGPGADTIVLAFDGGPDRIVGFERGRDVIDLSDWPMLYDTSRLEIAPFEAGAIITYFDETIRVVSDDRTPIESLSEIDFIFG